MSIAIGFVVIVAGIVWLVSILEGADERRVERLRRESARRAWDEKHGSR